MGYRGEDFFDFASLHEFRLFQTAAKLCNDGTTLSKMKTNIRKRINQYSKEWAKKREDNPDFMVTPDSSMINYLELLHTETAPTQFTEEKKLIFFSRRVG